MSVWLGLYIALAVLAVCQSMLLAVQTWENRRFTRSRIRCARPDATGQHVCLFAPCKGLDPDLADNLRPLFEQDHPSYELAFIVGEESDVACDPIRSLIAQYPRRSCRLIVAGEAFESGQKVHNLLAATERLPDHVDVLAFVDSDTRPRRDWLRSLVQRLGDPSVGATTGYRCFLPGPTLAAYCLYSMNCALSILLSPGPYKLVWGGSWAIRRETFDALEVRRAWVGTLSDDLVASSVLSQGGMRIEFEPACMLASPLDITWSSAFEFVRRQYLIGRFYAPGLWLLGLLLTTLGQATLIFSVCAAIVLAAYGSGLALLPAKVALLLYLLSIGRAVVRQDGVRHSLPQWDDRLRSARLFDIWLGPLGGLFNWIGLLASCCGDRIAWRGMKYRMFAGGRIRIIRPATTPHVAAGTRPFVAKAG